MPTTRSMRALSAVVSSASGAVAAKPTKPSRAAQRSNSKRTIEDTDSPDISSSAQTVKKAKVTPPSTISTNALPSSETNKLLPAVLSFSFETAKQHLITADPRFENVFSRLPCRPFEELETVDPFRTLVTSILGQQISWMAARSIIHKFIRLYFPSLPEKPPAKGSNDSKLPQEVFPEPSQVANTDIATLKTAGLSTRKAEYLIDLASRFADGRLSSQKLVEADDEELARLLIQVRGIGMWTVDMFAIFSLRRPDILPVGDLGVQRGVLRWFLALHSPKDAVTISRSKLPKSPSDDSPDKDTVPPQGIETSTSIQPQSDPGSSIPSDSLAKGEPYGSSIPPVPVTPVKGKATVALPTPETPSASPDKNGLDTGSMAAFPEPFTPSINKTLYSKNFVDADGLQKKEPAPLPDGLTVTSLKGRLNGKKIKGALLTPQEMETLTEAWRPYRSLGVYYMWALVEESPATSSKSSKASKSSK